MCYLISNNKGFFHLCTKVSLPDGKDKEQDDAALHKDKPQDGKEISLVKRDLQSQDSTSLGNGKVESEKAVEARKSQDVSHKAVNQSDSHKMDKLESLPDSLNTRTSLGISNRTAVKKGYEVMNSVKMRDLKSNSKLNGKQSSSLSSKSFKTLLSKSSSRRTKRSSLQVVDGVLKCYLFVSVAGISPRKQPTFRDPTTGFPAKWRLRNERINSILIYYLLLRSLQGNVRPRPYVLYQGRGLTFPCNDRMDEVNKLYIIWPFHYGPEPAIN